MRGARAAGLLAALAALSACDAPPVSDGGTGHLLTDPPVATFLTDDLLQVSFGYRGEPDRVLLRNLADCAAAEAVLLNGQNFARHVRTTVSEEAGNSRADAIYTVSPTVPAGSKTIDASAQAEACEEEGKPGI